jgi:hypothetical protein
MSDIQRARSYYNNGDWGAARVEYESLIAELIELRDETANQRNMLMNERDAALLKLHQLSEDHSHCEDLLNELGARASSAESRLHSVRLFIDTPHPHWGQGEVLDGVREILDGVVETHAKGCTRTRPHSGPCDDGIGELTGAVENQKPIAREQPIGKFAVLRDVRPDDPHTHKWVTDSLVGPTVCEICGIKVGGFE